MAEESTQSILIDAGPGEILAIIADFPNYPVWATSVRRAEVLERGSDGLALRVAFTLDAGIVKDQYELRYRWAAERVDWELTSGQMMRSQVGSYVLSSAPATPGSTLVTYRLRVELAIPMLGLLKRKAERVVMDTALKELKRRVESVRAAE